ncbi:hypothetical protein [Stenotrophomonas panacihumi]|uniref:hypothetical protein n=1 Tax=Stenotrophomonas panacihumi TaxID=676599 RepID=UPI000D3A985F|nr:hypothetical protein [Stenotrophomonas panacihumi]PTN55069.1 hypothetical protein C9J98_07680 [Stenotrophomonas panacihumi]
MTHPLPSPRRLDHELAAWRVSHALGPYQHLHFEREVAPILQAACEAYREYPGQERRMWRHLKRQLARQQAVHSTNEELRRIARDCWEDLQRAVD